MRALEALMGRILPLQIAKEPPPCDEGSSSLVRSHPTDRPSQPTELVLGVLGSSYDFPLVVEVGAEGERETLLADLQGESLVVGSDPEPVQLGKGSRGREGREG